MKSFFKIFIPDAYIRLLWHFPRAVFANVFFGFPGKQIVCIAIAGTKGKTSAAFFLHHILNASGKKTALFSTALAYDGKNKQLNVWKMTTPDAFALNRFLFRAKKNHCIYAVIEVSSHALKQYRVWGIPFLHIVITSLSPDHLEYHASANEYQKIHEKLFSKKTSSLIAPSDIKSLLYVPARIRFVPLSTQGTRGGPGSGTNSRVREIEPDPIEPVPIEPVPNAKLWWAPLQSANISIAITVSRTLGINNEQIAHALRMLPCPPGRFESIDAGQKFRVVVDYAHSPESLDYFLSRIRSLASGNLIIVFGACGDRDKAQRPVMGKILEQYADYIVLTTDDPYSEQPEDIAHDVERGFSQNKFTRIFDRKKAIAHAFSRAQPNDCVCILGKGAEQWQIFKDKKIPWDDRTTAKSLL